MVFLWFSHGFPAENSWSFPSPPSPGPHNLARSALRAPALTSEMVGKSVVEWKCYMGVSENVVYPYSHCICMHIYIYILVGGLEH